MRSLILFILFILFNINPALAPATQPQPIPLTKDGRCIQANIKKTKEQCRNFYGCSKNEDGTYSPNMAPCACKKELCDDIKEPKERSKR